MKATDDFEDDDESSKDHMSDSDETARETSNESNSDDSSSSSSEDEDGDVADKQPNYIQYSSTYKMFYNTKTKTYAPDWKHLLEEK